MYFLLEACKHPDILRVIYFGLIILDIITVIIPIGLIIMLIIDFTKAVVSTNTDGQTKSTKLVVKRIIYAVIVFAIPWIVDLFMGVLDSVGLKIGTDYNQCLTNARSGNFEYYDRLLELEEELTKKELENLTPGSNVSTTYNYKSAAEKLLDNAYKEIGTKGGVKYSGNTSQPWCAYFVMWNLKQVQISSSVGTVWDVITKEGRIGSCGGACAGDTTYNFFNNSNLQFYYSEYYGGSYTPKKGDLIYFWYPDNNGGVYWDKTVSGADKADHIGLVNYSSNGKVYTIEGNTGGTGNSATNVVAAKEYDLDYEGIIGYGSWYDKSGLPQKNNNNNNRVDQIN